MGLRERKGGWIRRRLTLVLSGVVVIAGSSLAAPAAHATSATVDVGVWDSMWSWVASCGTGSLSWRCTYTAQSSPTEGVPVNSTCTEAQANTGSVGANVECAADFSISLTAEWVFNSAGHKVGCTSVSGSDTGTADYYSGESSSFSGTNLPVTTDVRNGVVTVEGNHSTISSSGAFYTTWVVHLHIAAATCNPGTFVSGSSGAPGSVTVSYGDAGPQTTSTSTG